MKTAKLICPVFTLDNKRLLPGGKKITQETLDELIARNKGKSYPSIPFLDHGTVFQDLLRFLQKPPYNINFQESGRFEALELMNKINFVQPILRYYDYFKEHDFYTYRHSLVVFAFSTLMARDMLEETGDWIRDIMAGTIHDYGKICIPMKLLKKTDPLTKVDKIILEHHALAGFVLLSYFLQDYGRFAPWVAKEHHERADGSGYPLGIRLNDRMVEIIGVCDIYDALLSPRPHRPTPYDNRTALEKITSMAKQGKLSWDVVQTLVSYSRKGRPHFRECSVSTEKRGVILADDSYGITGNKMECPNCRGTAVEKKTLKDGKEYISFECRGCGKEFTQDDLLNLEMDLS